MAKVQWLKIFPHNFSSSAAVNVGFNNLASVLACFALICPTSHLIVSSHIRKTILWVVPGRAVSLRAARRIKASPARSLFGLVAIM